MGNVTTFTPEKLAKVYLRIIGDQQQFSTTAAPDVFRDTLAGMGIRGYSAIPEDVHLAALKIAKLNYAKEGDFSFTLWRKGTQKQPVPPATVRPQKANTSRRIATAKSKPIASTTKKTQVAADDPCAVLAKLQAERKRAGIISATGTPWELAMAARKLVEFEAKAGHALSYATAVLRVQRNTNDYAAAVERLVNG